MVLQQSALYSLMKLTIIENQIEHELEAEAI